MLKKSRLYSILFNKCPKCHRGQIFKHQSAYWPVTEFDKMNQSCSECGQNFVPEPGFYYGAMYMSYAFYVMVILVIVPIGLTWLDLDITTLMGILIVLFIILTPVFFRMARRAWLAIFVPYSGEEKKELG
ncbi:MAG: hypothetical protein ABS46_02800 [Cytophagaceae bacterium SCN 52-12]|nr:MAG: hypothetical protein ABS46_02800 [Cytophagaceae bacterium SCN 52-12]